MSVQNASADLRQEHVGVHVGQIDGRALLDGLGVGEDAGEAQRFAAIDVQRVGDCEHGRGLRRAGLGLPRVEGRAGHAAALVELRFGQAARLERFDDDGVKRGGRGSFAHISFVARCSESYCYLRMHIV